MLNTSDFSQDRSDSQTVLAYAMLGVAYICLQNNGMLPGRRPVFNFRRRLILKK